MKWLVYSLVITASLYLFIVIPAKAQVLTNELIGILEVYTSEDPTSLYIGKDVGKDLDPLEQLGNTFVGSESGKLTWIGEDNSFFGFRSGTENQTGSGNSFFGSSAGNQNAGNRNSYFGTASGLNIIRGSNNICLGYTSGPPDDDTLSNRLFIDIIQTYTPLIYGEFDNDLVQIHGDLKAVTEDGQMTSIGLFEESNDELFGYEFQYDGAPATDNLYLWSRNFSGNEAIRMTWTKQGRVGIGILPTEKLHVDGNILATGTVTGNSDQNNKENITPIDHHSILDKIANLPISEWQYRGEEVRHIGPMAQDFYAAFQVGSGETSISMVDADGIALAAIKALKEENEALKTQLIELTKRIQALEQNTDEALVDKCNM